MDISSIYNAVSLPYALPYAWLDVAMTPCGPRGRLCHCVQKEHHYSKAIG